MKDLMFDFFFVIVLTIIFMASLWCIDISLSALIVNRPLIGIRNIDVDPNVSYHAGLLVANICFLLMASLFFYSKLEKLKKY